MTHDALTPAELEKLTRADLEEADQAVRDAERTLAVAQRARILTIAACETGEMCLQNPGESRITKRAEFPYIFSQAWSLASRLTR